MNAPVVPVAQIERRLPTAGRLRFGDKSGTRGAPKALDKWRATSHDRTAIDQLAATYGGTPREWKGAPGRGVQWEVMTAAAELDVYLPPDPLGAGPVYELWSGGGCQRRCDGERCQTWQQGPEGAEPVEVACICFANKNHECSVKTRLSVVLPNVRFGGVWRLDTSSWYAAHEMPGMVDMILQLQQGGRITRAVLRLERESKPGKSFVVPRLGLANTAEELVAGSAAVGALAAGGNVSVARALDSGVPRGEWFEQEVPPGPDPIRDDGIVDAEIVEDGPSQPQLALLHMLQTQTKAGEPWPPDLEMSDGQYRDLLEGKWRVRSAKDLSKGQVSEAIDAFSDPSKRRAALLWLEKQGA